MNIIDNKKDCCGCTACFNICPYDAIEMVEDFEGFLYPKINKNKCVNCGLCKNKCPHNNVKNVNTLNKAYSLRTKNKQVLISSTSGGFFSPIAEYVVSNNGIVCGVGFDREFKVIHKIANTLEEVNEFRGSKYVQSYLGNIFRTIKYELENKKVVLFSGTPCQVEGLFSFLNKEYDNLITVDLICHGTPSQKLWKKYIDYQENKYKSKIKNVNFRNKTYGYHSGSMKIEFTNGKKYYGSARVDYMLKSFFKEISSRPSCYDCKFKTKHHKSDFTIYDCWNIEKLKENIKDDDKGYTNLIINSNKGVEIFNLIKEKFYFYEVNIDKQIELDGIMVEKSAVPHKNREEFYVDLEKEDLKKHINKYIPITIKDYFIERMKFFVYKLKILNIIKKALKK